MFQVLPEEPVSLYGNTNNINFRCLKYYSKCVNVLSKGFFSILGIVLGATGLRGHTGIDGPPGPTGPTGAIGVPGPTGGTGRPGGPGRDGKTGTTGQTGPTGATGRRGDTEFRELQVSLETPGQQVHLESQVPKVFKEFQVRCTEIIDCCVCLVFMDIFGKFYLDLISLLQ